MRGFFVSLMVLTILTPLMGNGEWHEKAERRGEVPPSIGAQASVSSPQHNPYPPAITLQQKGNPQKSSLAAFIVQHLKKLDWALIGVIVLWAITALLIIIALKPVKQTK